MINDNVQGKIFVTGNPMVDAAYQNLEFAKDQSAILEKFNLEFRDYLVLTIHREENVDSRENLTNVLEG